jgi:hypothetical protein
VPLPFIVQSALRGRRLRRWRTRMLIIRPLLLKLMFHWRLNRSIRRKRVASLAVRRFIEEVVARDDTTAARSALFRYMKHFTVSVRRIQRTVRTFLACRFGG